jgi:MFS family permease
VSYEGEIPARQYGQAARVRGSYRLMFDPVFGPFFWGKLLSSLGIWIHNIVAAIVAFELTGSALVVGLVTAVQFAPQLLFAPLSGKMADRGNAPLQIVTGRIVTGLGSAGLAVWIWLAGGVDGLPGAAPVLASSLVVGLGFVVGGPAMQSVVPSMIRPGEMAAAMALNSVPMTVARAGGPAAGALVATQLGPASAFAIAAAANAAYGLVVLALRLPRGIAHVDTDFSVRASLRHLRSDRPLLMLLVGIAAVGVGAEPSITLGPALAAELGGGAGLVGWLASAFGIGAGVGFLLFAPLHRWVDLPWLGSAGLLIMAAGMVVAAAGGVPAVALGAFGVSGVGMTLAFTSITTRIQDRAPDSLRGRIMALWFVGFLGARPFAAGLTGYLADSISVGVALLTTAAAVTVAAYLTRPDRSAVPWRV